MTASSAAIAEVRSNWVQSLNIGSVEAFAACVTDDAVWIPARGDAQAGVDAIVRWLRPYFEEYRYTYSTSNEQLQLAGGWAVEESRFRSEMHRKGEGSALPLVHEGRYIMLWQAIAPDKWRINRYIDRPLAIIGALHPAAKVD